MKTLRIKSVILILGDLSVFYLGLVTMLFLRYGLEKFEKWWLLHVFSFSALFVIWIVIFWIAGLYDLLSFFSRQKIGERIIQTMFFAGILSTAIFYVWQQQIVITPKTNLLIDLAISTFLLIVWRKIYEKILASSQKNRLIFLGWSKETLELSNTLQDNPHFGYEPVAAVIPHNSPSNQHINLPIFSLDNNLSKIVREKEVNLVVASLDIHSNPDFTKMLYGVLPLGVTYVNFPRFYEETLGKIPVSMISEIWFLENLAENEKRFFEAGKRAFDIFSGVVLGILTILILAPAALAIKLESSGPVFFRQRRVGKNGKIFDLAKFRSKTHDGAEKNSGWNKEEDEKRSTFFGKILRKTYIDELPQALNIVKGEMSLIGPRPERPEFVEDLKKQIPHYMMRLLVRPGISGWAQINMKYDASAADALEKLQYDLYYIKNRSLGLDLYIALKTLFTMISHAGK